MKQKLELKKKTKINLEALRLFVFNLLDEEEQKKCFHYTNLQPLWASENLSKGCKYIDENI